jgi:hypothetical protein
MAFDPSFLNNLLAKPTLTAVDAVRLEDALLNDGPVTEVEALMLLAIECAPSIKHPAWKGVFIDSMLQFAIHSAEPYGYLTVGKADWLLRQAAPRGRILTATVFEMLTALLAKARWVPDRIVSALLDEVCCGVRFGDGPLAPDTGRVPGAIMERDADIVRAILYGASAFDGQAITRTELDGLLAIDRAGAGHPSPANWTELAAKALMDAALSASGWRTPSREGILGAFGPAQSGPTVSVLASLSQQYAPMTQQDEAIVALERQRHEIVTGDPVVPCTVPWLAHVLERDRLQTPAQMLFAGWLGACGGMVEGQLRVDAPIRRDSHAA